MHDSLASFISEISNTLIDNEEDLDVIVSMYKLLSTAKIIQNKKQKNKKTKKKQKVSGIITEMNETVVLQKIKIILLEIPNLLIIKQVLQEN